MNKKYLAAFVLITIAILTLLFKERPAREMSVTHKIPKEHIKVVEDKDISEAIEENQGSTEASVDDIIVGPEEHWEEHVKVQLKRQAFDDSVEVDITKENSIFWEELGTPIEANTIKVQLRNPAGETTSFRALIDSNTGKILRTWDRPVIDPINPRERRGIKVSPRYHANN